MLGWWVLDVKLRKLKRQKFSRHVTFTKVRVRLEGWLHIHPGHWIRPYNYKEIPK